MSKTSLADTQRAARIVGLILALGSFFVLGLLGIHSAHENLGNVHSDAQILVQEWGVTLLVLAVLVFWERETLAAIGIRWPGWRDWLAALGALFAIYVFLVVIKLTLHLQISATQLQQVATLPIWLRILLSVTPAICEEILFRGYAITRLAPLVRGPWIAAIISSILFGLAHYGRYGFNATLLLPGVIGFGLAALYVWRRNLVVCMAVHFVIDGLAIVIAPIFMPH